MITTHMSSEHQLRWILPTEMLYTPTWKDQRRPENHIYIYIYIYVFTYYKITNKIL
uniref:Uncharacterized protein n=1 Tax=Physcomitrium patens TaxID=3218 RepID=A0A7I3ZFL3_PHYPA